MTNKDDILWQQRNDQLGHLPSHILQALALNESATLEWRKAAIEIMLDHGYPVEHPGLMSLLGDVLKTREAKEEIQDIVETAIESPLPILKAGFTTANQMQGSCTKPPRGWRCTRELGHDGPCAAIEVDDEDR